MPGRGHLRQLGPAHQHRHPGLVGGGRHHRLKDEAVGDLSQVGPVGEDQTGGEVLVFSTLARVVRQAQVSGLTEES